MTDSLLTSNHEHRECIVPPWILNGGDDMKQDWASTWDPANTNQWYKATEKGFGLRVNILPFAVVCTRDCLHPNYIFFINLQTVCSLVHFVHSDMKYSELNVPQQNTRLAVFFPSQEVKLPVLDWLSAWRSNVIHQRGCAAGTAVARPAEWRKQARSAESRRF